MNNYTYLYEATDELLKQAIDLDKHVFYKKDIGDISKCKEWLEINKDIYTFLLCDGKLIGYINFTRITDECFERFIKGNMKDYNMTKRDILPFEHGDNKCLFTSIALVKEKRDGEAIIELRKAFNKKLEKFKEQGIIIKDVIIDCVSVDGIKYSIQQLNAKYVKKSNGGKIYYSKDIFNSRPVPKISLELLDKNNINDVALIQYEIFKNYWCGYLDLLNEIKSRKNNLPKTYLIKYQGKNVGIIGLYELEQYKDVIWLNWLGVLPEYRNRGIGTHALFKIIDLARTYNRKEFRLVTYKIWNNKAQRLYIKTMQRSEPYKNKEDWQFGIKNGHAMIFSSSLVDKKVSKWNNKYIALNDDIILNNESIKKLKEDKLID